MKKIVIEKPGGYERLLIKEFPDLSVKAGEVLIDVKAAGVNFADCLVRMGVYQSAKEFVGWPITPGFEISGIVREVGEGVARCRPGDRVIAATRFGGYATQIAVPASNVFPLPETLDFVQGAGFPTVFLTAYFALHELAHPRSGEALLVHSAAGGVGSALVQLGKAAGCRVAGVVGSSHKVEYVKALGADAVIDKSSEDLWKKAEEFSPGGYDIIMDPNGAATLKQSYGHLAPMGKLVIYGFHTMLTKGRGTPNWLKVFWDYLRTPRFNPLTMTSDNHSVLAFNLSYLFDKIDLFKEITEKLLSFFEEGKIHPLQTTVYPFEGAAEAHKALETGSTVGKIVLT